MEKSSDLAGKKIRKMENKAYHYLCVVKKQKATLSKTCFISLNVIVAQPSLASSMNRLRNIVCCLLQACSKSSVTEK